MLTVWSWTRSSFRICVSANWASRAESLSRWDSNRLRFSSACLSSCWTNTLRYWFCSVATLSLPCKWQEGSQQILINVKSQNQTSRNSSTICRRSFSKTRLSCSLMVEPLESTSDGWWCLTSCNWAAKLWSVLRPSSFHPFYRKITEKNEKFVRPRVSTGSFERQFDAVTHIHDYYQIVDGVLSCKIPPPSCELCLRDLPFPILLLRRCDVWLHPTLLAPNAKRDPILRHIRIWAWRRMKQKHTQSLWLI